MKKTYERIEELRDTAEHIDSGDVVWIGGTEGPAAEFLAALAQRRDELANVTLLVVTGKEPNATLDTLRHCGSFRVLSFYRDAITETYRDGSNSERYEFVTSPAAKAIGLVCRHYNVNTMVLPVCQPGRENRFAVGEAQALSAEMVNACPSVTKRIALVDYKMKASRRSLPIDSFDAIGLYGDLKTRDIFDNSTAAERKSAEAAA